MVEGKIQERLDENVDADSQDEKASSNGEDDIVSGWADSMSKILRSTKPKAKKNIILSRAKKDYEVGWSLFKKSCL